MHVNFAKFGLLQGPLVIRLLHNLKVDFVLGDCQVALEVKGTHFAQSNHLKGLIAFGEEYKTKRRILVSCDPKPRLVSGHIEILPWKIFLEDLWAGKIIR